jgi:hypothetical protein
MEFIHFPRGFVEFCKHSVSGIAHFAFTFLFARHARMLGSAAMQWLHRRKLESAHLGET